jgi:uncharacterized protein YecE (DUF72 family)
LSRNAPRPDLGLLRIGTAGWTVPRVHAEHFSAEGSQLARYAGVFSAAEINSSFYRSHRPATYARWAASVPDDFRFAVKLPRAITHERRLVDVAEPLEAFVAETSALGEKRGPLLVQLPPSFAYDPAVVQPFLALLRERWSGAAVCEPRHPTWFTAEADDALRSFEVARVAADPARVEVAAKPGGWAGLIYYRLHGSPQMYFSGYEPAYLDALARALMEHAGSGVPAWCIFDNTIRGEAAANAVATLRRIEALAG